MTEWVSALGNTTVSPVSMGIVFPYATVALAVMISISHYSVLNERYGDAKGMWIYFSLFFLLLAAVPALIIVIAESDPPRALADLGIAVGNARVGLLLIAVAVPISLLIGRAVSVTPEMVAWYPFSKRVCARDRTFILYELGYLLLYYTAWEFLYRGVFFFPLLRGFGYLPAMAVTTALSTLHHIGHPKSEIAGAVLGGVIFSAIAVATRSILYPILIHAMIGIVNDTLIYLRNYRRHSER